MTLVAKAALRAGIPLVIMTAIGLVLLNQGKADDGRSTLVTGVIVAAVAGATVIYEIEEWSLARQSAVHFLLMCVTVLPAIYLSGWATFDSVGDHVGVIAGFLLVGALIWSAMYAFHRWRDSRH
ncbi:DUF3021 domain-containing protein [Kytococcus sedentarius]|uniref:DUF3021 domain-containing protein n=1 Tax=Kytococcus sedentarius TaxID=1276 RepID=UPI0035BBC2C6